SITLSPTAPDVRLVEGSNAGQADLGGSTITVTITGSTKASITIHPTNERTYYKNVTVIVNTGSATYYGWIKVNTPISANGITAAKLIIKDTSGATVATVDLMSTTLQGGGFSIPAGGKLFIDIEVQIDSTIDPTTITSGNVASIDLVYSPQSVETPP
ncbi:MAG: hypothetical protein DRO39_05815, partial [Thermoprotei archaeon]